jgi:tripartite-type tricarboxylate transporter receptor subunit TctC
MNLNGAVRKPADAFIARRYAFAGILAVSISLAGGAMAQTTGGGTGPTYPTKPIRLVLGFSPGGSSDILARVLGQKLTDALGQPIVVDNRPGAGGNIAAEIVANSAADGYTLLLGNQGILATNISLYSRLAYNPVKDFSPIVLLAAQPTVLVVNPSLPVKSVQELIALAKKKPGQLNFASSGNGTATHLTGELFGSMTGIKMVHVPYKGASRALTDVINGQVQLMFASITSAKPQISAGRVRALAVTSATRSPALPQLPTVAESGVPGFERQAWHGIVAPMGTPAPIIRRLNTELNKILQTAEVRTVLSRQGAVIVGGTPQEFANHIRAEIPKWAKIIKESGARIN